MQTCACSQNNSYKKEKLSAILFIQKLTLFGGGGVCVVTSCPIVYDLMDCSPPMGLLRWDSPGKNTRMGCQALSQGISLTQGLNRNLPYPLHWHAGSLLLGPLGVEAQLFSTLCLLFSGVFIKVP